MFRKLLDSNLAAYFLIFTLFQNGIKYVIMSLGRVKIMTDAFNIFNNIDKRCSQVFDIIQKEGPITKNKLIEMTNMKKSTLNRTMEALLDKELVVEIANGESTGGRKPVIFDVNPGKYYLIGIDISRTYIHVLIAKLNMDILEEKFSYGRFSVNDAVGFISECVNQLLDQSSVDISSVIGAGIGAVASKLGSESSNSYENTAYTIKNLLSEKLNLPFYIDNGANTAVMAEYYFGYGRGKHSISYINCGVGIRTGVISGGTLIRTINNCEDAFGHMVVQMDGELCTCGNYGCVESYSSINRIRNKFVSEMKKGKNTNLTKSVDDVDYIDVCSLAESSDELAISIIIDAATYFGTGLANYIKLLNPETIILSGPLIKHSLLFYETSKEVALNKCRSVNTENIEFHRGGYFENKSIALGAAFLPLDEIMKNNIRR